MRSTASNLAILISKASESRKCRPLRDIYAYGTAVARIGAPKRLSHCQLGIIIIVTIFLPNNAIERTLRGHIYTKERQEYSDHTLLNYYFVPSCYPREN